KLRMFSGGSVYDRILSHPLTPNAPLMRPSRTRVSSRLSLRPLIASRRASRRLGAAAILLDQALHALGRLRTLRQPVAGPLEVDLQALLGAGRDRVEKAQAFDVAAVAARSTVGDHDVVERPLLRAGA